MKGRIKDLTVLLITFNEEANVKRTIESVAFAERILVVDSFSTDSTIEDVRQFENARVIQRKFVSFADQCNFGLQQVNTKWVLSIDADYCFPPAAEDVIATVVTGIDCFYEVAFDYCINGRPVRGGILPPRVVLFPVKGAHYVDDGHSHHLEVNSATIRLPFKIRHDDRKPLLRWATAQVKYAEQEAQKIDGHTFASLRFNDKVRKLIVVAPPAVFLLVFFIRGGFLSGWRGLFYAMQRFTAELLLSLNLVERMISRKES